MRTALALSGLNCNLSSSKIWNHGKRDAFCDLVPFAQLKKRENTHEGLLKPATSLKAALLNGCFSRFLNCINGTKSCNAFLYAIVFIHRLTPWLILLREIRALTEGNGFDDEYVGKFR